MDFTKVRRGEIIAVFGGLLLALGLFLKWYHVKTNGAIGSHGPGDYSAWEVHPIMRFPLLLGAAAPLILTWIIARNHKLSWPRGEMTSVVAIIAIGLIGYNGLIDRPGSGNDLVSPKFGLLVALLGAFAMLFGSVQRQQETETKRKPPGVI